MEERKEIKQKHYSAFPDKILQYISHLLFLHPLPCAFQMGTQTYSQVNEMK